MFNRRDDETRRISEEAGNNQNGFTESIGKHRIPAKRDRVGNKITQTGRGGEINRTDSNIQKENDQEVFAHRHTHQDTRRNKSFK